MSQYVAPVAGAALGYIHGNWRGARIGAALGSALTQNSRNMAPITRSKASDTKMVEVAVQTSATSSRPRRKTTLVVKSVKKRKRGASKKKKGRKPNLSKRIKTIVDKALHVERPLGRYFKEWGCIAGNLNNNQKLILDGSNILQSNVAFSGNELVHMNTHKLLDAVSVLFNGIAGKTAALDYTSAGNLVSTDLKFYLEKAKSEITIRNVTSLIIDFDVVIAKTKKATTLTFGNNYRDALTSTNITQSGGVTATTNQVTVNPYVLPSLIQNYRMKSHKFTLKPGDQRTITLVTRGRHIDFNKYRDGTTLQTYIPGLTQEVCVQMQPALDLTYNSAPAAVNAGLYVNNNDTYGVVMRVKEFYKLRSPENVDWAAEEDRYAFYNFYTAASASAKNVIKSTTDITCNQ